jgi:ATP synthase protein I
MLAVDFGYTLLASVLLFGGGGYWLDRNRGTTPWFMLLGIGLGLAVGFNSLFRRLARLEKKEKAERNRPPDNPHERR